MKKIITLLLVLLLADSFAFAQLIIDKSKIKLEIKPGETFSDVITLANSGNEPINVRVYFEDFKYLPPFDGRKEFINPSLSGNPMASWLNFSPQDFTLSPGTERKVTYSIKIPNDIKNEGYYGVLFFEIGAGQIKNAEVDLKVIQRIGCLFFLETKNRLKKSEIKNITINSLSISGRFSNSGNIVLIPRGTYYIMSDDGNVVTRGEIKQMYIPANEAASFSLEFPKSLPQGNFTAVITFDLEDGDALVKEIDFSNNAASGPILLQTRD